MGVRDLASAASVSPATITRFENERGQMSVKSINAIVRVLAAHGIEFIPGGVRMKGQGRDAEA